VCGFGGGGVGGGGVEKSLKVLAAEVYKSDF